MSNINEAIRTRRSVYPAQYLEKPIPKDVIKALLINANHAPTHKLTEPWRFKVFMNEAKIALGSFMANKYKETASAYSDAKFEKINSNFQNAGAAIAIILHRDPKERVPEWEETAAVAMAVQNIWVALDQYELGGFWSSPGFSSFLGEYTSLKENEKCLGFFFIAYCNPLDKVIKKGPIDEKVEWIE